MAPENRIEKNDHAQKRAPEEEMDEGHETNHLTGTLNLRRAEAALAEEATKGEDDSLELGVKSRKGF